MFKNQLRQIIMYTFVSHSDAVPLTEKYIIACYDEGHLVLFNTIEIYILLSVNMFEGMITENA